MICLAVFSVANAESTASVYERIINIHDSLPSYIIQITDTGEDTADVDSDNILLPVSPWRRITTDSGFLRS